MCPLLREVLEDGLRQYGGSLFSKKMNLWRLIDLTTPTTGRIHEAKTKAQLGLSSTVDWIEKFNAFIYHLLKYVHQGCRASSLFLSLSFSIHELAAWLTHFVSHRVMLATHYESWAFILVHGDNDLFERVTNQLEKLSPLPFRLKYTHSSHVIPASRATAAAATAANQRPSSLLPKRFNVRAWLRDRKTQIKISPREPQAPSASSSSTSSSSISKVPSLSTLHPPPPPPVKSIPSASAKHASTVLPSAPLPPPNVSLRRKIGSIPVPKRNQTVH